MTNDRRPVFTDAMLACCANTMQPSARNLVELVEFNGEADHVDLLVAYPPTLANARLAQRLKGHTS
ncbi:MAG: REP-associated tyrosine transposase [Mycobacterium sp.]|nr:REP-associated tyrosine transposase [Mycobacterium sp.]